MGVGGRRTDWEVCEGAKLIMAYSGVTRFSSTAWVHCCHEGWVLDYINDGQQRQRVGNGAEFLRLSGVAALYR